MAHLSFGWQIQIDHDYFFLNEFNSNPSPENECNYTVCNYLYFIIIVVKVSFDHKVNYCDGGWHCQLSTTLGSVGGLVCRTTNVYKREEKRTENKSEKR